MTENIFIEELKLLGYEIEKTKLNQLEKYYDLIVELIKK